MEMFEMSAIKQFRSKSDGICIFKMKVKFAFIITSLFIFHFMLVRLIVRMPMKMEHMFSACKKETPLFGRHYMPCTEPAFKPPPLAIAKCVEEKSPSSTFTDEEIH